MDQPTSTNADQCKDPGWKDCMQEEKEVEGDGRSNSTKRMDQMRYKGRMPNRWKQARMISAVASHSIRRLSSSGVPITWQLP